MFNFSTLSLNSLSLHHVGNKLNAEEIQFSQHLLEVDENTRKILVNYFLSPFQSEEYYNLYHESDINLNEVFVYASRIFDKPETLHKESVNLAKHLYEQSAHPKIKPGEFCTVYFKNCIFNGETLDAIGLFKSENKHTFLKVLRTDNDFSIIPDFGINVEKLDKACLIYNTQKQQGFVVSVLDNTNKSTDAQYWFDNFLHVKSRNDEYFNTRSLLNMCKTFVTEQLPKQFETTKADQVDLLNKSVKFFKENENFSLGKFANEVMEQPEIISSFNKFKSDYQNNYQVEIADEFQISGQAVKKQARVFKSIIKLDKNFHIYIHGNRNMIEQGVDENGRKYYKIYYREES